MDGLFKVSIRTAGKPFGTAEGEFVRLTALGLVVSEHVDKIGFFEPTVEVVEKEVDVGCLRFSLRCTGTQKPIEEIVRGFRIGCFKIAREYGIVEVADERPVFAPDFAVREISAGEGKSI